MPPRRARTVEDIYVRDEVARVAQQVEAFTQQMMGQVAILSQQVVDLTAAVTSAMQPCREPEEEEEEDESYNPFAEDFPRWNNHKDNRGYDTDEDQEDEGPVFDEEPEEDEIVHDDHIVALVTRQVCFTPKEDKAAADQEDEGPVFDEEPEEEEIVHDNHIVALITRRVCFTPKEDKAAANQKRRHVEFEVGDFVRASHIRTADVSNVEHLVPYHDDNSDEDAANSRTNSIHPEENDADADADAVHVIASAFEVGLDRRTGRKPKYRTLVQVGSDGVRIRQKLVVGLKTSI